MNTMSSLLKIDGRTVRGRQWREMNSCGKPLKQGILQLKKVCSKCNASPEDDEKVECMNCHQFFHITCLLKPLHPDFLDTIAENPSVYWFCPGCIPTKAADHPVETSSNELSDSSMSNVILTSTLLNFKKEILSLVSETMESKLQMIPGLMAAGHSESKKQQPGTDVPVISGGSKEPSWADMCNIPPAPKSTQQGKTDSPKTNAQEDHQPVEKHVLLLEPKDAETMKSDGGKKQSLQTIGKAIQDVNVEFCSVKKSGLIAVGFADEKSKKLAEDKMKGNTALSQSFLTRAPRKLLPKVTVSGISEILFDDCKDDKAQMKKVLYDDIVKRNSCISNILDHDSNETLDVVMVQKIMPNHNFVQYIAALKMTAKLRQAIADNGDKLYVSMKRCKVVDRYHVLQCYNCFVPGHSADECSSTTPDGELIPTCGFCAKEHKSSACPVKNNPEKHCCANCLRSDNPEISKGARSHSATNRNCPILQSHIKVIKNKTFDWKRKNPK